MPAPALPNGGFAEIIQTVNTPLALAALSLLVVGAVVYANIKQPNGPLILYGFLLAGVFGVLAIAGFLWQEQIDSIKIARGSVVTNGGRPLEGAIVDLNGAGRTATLEDGSFRVPIERQDERVSYTVEISKAGYKSIRLDSVKGPVPESRKYVLERSVFSAASLGLPRQIGIGVYAGAPELILEFTIDNTTDLDETGTGMVSLSSPSGQTIRLYPAWRAKDNVRAQVLSPFIFPKLQRESYLVAWNDGPQFMNAVQSVNAAMSKSANNGCFSGAPMSAETIDNLRDVFNENFLWEAGDWSGNVIISMRQGTIEAPFSFSLDQSSFTSLRNVREAQRNCRGLILGSHEFSSGLARSPVFVAVK